MSHYLSLYRVMSRTFHVRLRLIGAFLLFQLRGTISAVTLALDNVVYPKYRKQSLDRPVFIIGNPRSGTTFLHRLLLGAGDMAAFELWEMLFPAVTARKLLGGIVPRFDKLNPARYHPSDAHDTSLRGIETDDVLWFFRTLDGPFAWAYFHAWQDTWGSELSRRSFGIAEVPRAEEDRFFRYYEACWRRSLALKGSRRILVKSSMLTFRLKALLRRYPDCKLLYVVRDPVEVIPSGISLLSGALENAYNIWESTSEADQKHWLENLYQASATMLSSFHDAFVAGEIPDRNLCVVRYPDLIGNLEPTIDRILEFIEVDAPEAFLAEVRGQGERQRAHTSKHGYSAEQFGLDPKRIRAELGFVYKTFGLDETSSNDDQLTNSPEDAPL